MNGYELFFPTNKQLPFRKMRWTIMVIIQELSKGKYKSVAKYFYNKKYHADINVLCEILSKGKLKSTVVQLAVKNIHQSHEINYPKWVDKIQNDLGFGRDVCKIKVFNHEGRFIVIDGNHRLLAMKRFYDSNKLVDVRLLTYLDCKS